MHVAVQGVDRKIPGQLKSGHSQHRSWTMRNSCGLGPRRKERVRCAIYTRKSSEEGLRQEFNSLTRTPARKAAPLDLGALLAVRDGLSAGASGLRTRGPIRASFITDARRQFQGTAFYHETARQ